MDCDSKEVLPSHQDFSHQETYVYEDNSKISNVEAPGPQRDHNNH